MDAAPHASSLEEAHVLATVHLIQRRALGTAIVTALAGTLLAAWVWWQTCFPVAAVGPQQALTPREAELADQVRLVTAHLKLSLRLFAVTVCVLAVGVVIVIVSYARQTARLLKLIEGRSVPGRSA